MSENLPQFDFVGPTVGDDLRRLIRRYGAAAVSEAYKIETARKRGRPHEKEWQEIAGIVREDAREWLAGRDPFNQRRNATIARNYADIHPGQSRESTFRRVAQKLARSRRYVTLSEAEVLARTEYPFGQYLRAVDALLAIGKHAALWEQARSRALLSVDEYERKFGPVPERLTIKQVEAVAAKPLPAAPTTKNRNVLQLLVGKPPR